MTEPTKSEWLELFLEAKKIGLTIEQIKSFLINQKGEPK
ncbi:anti-repressor SinI family protein [Bacillus weihaiensis]|nr:anti-repressor SinI family protein [Bacillus weihaiensis]